jgi:UDP-GlcNAc:undecaprenyl-phosphate GlcNAc-1-phosphate transferase
MPAPAIVALVAFSAALLLTPLCRVLARRINAVDSKSERGLGGSSPRIGGVAIALGAVAGVLTTAASRDADVAIVLLLALPLALVGLVDDLRNVHPFFARIEAWPHWWAVKLFVQLVPASLAVLFAHLFRLQGFWLLVLGPVAVLFIASVTNAVNFMDGINGIAGLEAVVAGGALSFMLIARGDLDFGLLPLALACGAAGFLPYNLRSGSIYMGDFGATSIGFILGASVLRAISLGTHPIVATLPLLPFLADTGLTLLRRWRKGARLFSAHREHYYQRLTARLGRGHAIVALLWCAMAILCSVSAVAYDSGSAGIWITNVPVAIGIVVFLLIDRYAPA